MPDIRGLWSLGLLSFLAALLLAGIYQLFASKRKLKLPSLGDPQAADLGGAVLDGYSKHHDSLFSLPTERIATVVMPRQFLPATANLPDSRMSLFREVYERFMGKYTKMLKSDHLQNYVRHDLVKNLKAYLPMVDEESRRAVREALPDASTDAWTAMPTVPMILKASALVTERVLAGPRLARNAEWVQLTVDCALATGRLAATMTATPPLWRPFKALYCKDMVAMKRYYAKAAQMLEADSVHWGTMESSGAKTDSGPRTLSDSMLASSSNPRAPVDFDLHARMQIEGAQAIHFNLAFSLAHVLHDLAVHPEYIEPLRKEWQDQLNKHDNAVTYQSLSEMWKLDSFLKESQRLHPPSLVSVSRWVVSAVTLPNGLVLPPDTSVSVPTHGVNLDPSLWSDPNSFDGFRFEKLRMKEGFSHRYQFSSVSLDELNFGYGRCSCPGRWIVSMQSKLLVGLLLQDFDLKLPEGVNPPGNNFAGVRNMPDFDFKLLYRRREKVSLPNPALGDFPSS